MSDKDKYYIDGYGTKRPKDVPFWDSAKGQLVKKAGNDLLTTGSFALGITSIWEIKDIKDSF